MTSRGLHASPSTVFISYSHQDSDWLKRVHVHLKPLQDSYPLILEIWDDTRIAAGIQWHAEIRQAIAAARVAVLLISADFFASDFITKNELPPLLLAAEKSGTVIVPVIVSASRFARTQLAEFQALNDPARGLVGMSKAEQEEILDELSRRIDQLLVGSTAQIGAVGLRVPPAALAAGALPSNPHLTQLSIGSATQLISDYATSRHIQIGPIESAPRSLFNTRSFRARADDGKGVVYCHADGKYEGHTFYVRKGIGWFYEQVLLGAASRLGLPTSSEELADGTGYPISYFEGGYIEWSPKTTVARAVATTSNGVQTLAERKL